jgi:hypothetical protein
VGARFGVLAVCVAAIVVLAGRLGTQDGCGDARQRLFALGARGSGPPAVLARDARMLRADCRDVEDLAGGAVSVLLAGDQRGALDLARTATRRGPDVFSAWVALEATQRRADPVAARRAEARARALNPRWTGPAPLPAPRGGAGP